MRTRQRPSVGWYWAAGGIALMGLVGAVAWGLLAYFEFSDRVVAFPRTDVPGVAAVDVTDPQDLAIYYEAPRVAGDETVPALDIHVTDPTGLPVAAQPYDVDQRF